MSKGFRLFALALLLTLVALSAMADATVQIQPTFSDLSQEYLREFAAEFLSRKMGIEKAYYKEVKMSFTLWQNGRTMADDGKTLVDPRGEAFWFVDVLDYYFVDKYGGSGVPPYMILSREGDIMEWSAYGPAFNEADPDLMTQGVQAEPLPTDATVEEIIVSAKADLADKFGVSNADEFTYQAAFITHEAFNDGKIPVWLTYVFDSGTFKWKGVYAYDGSFMSIVPAEQDFRLYTTPNQHFFLEVFGDTLEDLSVEVKNNYISEEESINWLKIVAPKYEEWRLTHPYADNVTSIDELIKQFQPCIVCRHS